MMELTHKFDDEDRKIVENLLKSAIGFLSVRVNQLSSEFNLRTVDKPKEGIPEDFYISKKQAKYLHAEQALSDLLEFVEVS